MLFKLLCLNTWAVFGFLLITYMFIEVLSKGPPKRLFFNSKKAVKYWLKNINIFKAVTQRIQVVIKVMVEFVSMRVMSKPQILQCSSYFCDRKQKNDNLIKNFLFIAMIQSNLFNLTSKLFFGYGIGFLPHLEDDYIF